MAHPSVGVDVARFGSATADGVAVQPFHLQINLFNRTATQLELVAGSERAVPLVPPARYLARPPATLAPCGNGAFIITNEDPSGVPHSVPASGSIAYAISGDPEGAAFNLQWARAAESPAQSAVVSVTPASAATRFKFQKDAGAAGQISFQLIPAEAPQPRPGETPAEPGQPAASRTVALNISNRTGVPLVFNGSTWNSKSDVDFTNEPKSDLAAGADFTSSMRFTLADANGEEIAQKFTFNYKGRDANGAAVKIALGFTVKGGNVAPHCYVDPSPPYSHHDSGDADSVGFVLTHSAPAVPAKKLDLRGCKLQQNQVDGPRHHVLCSVHGHVVNTLDSTEVAASIEEYHRIYWIGRPAVDCQPDPGKLPYAPKNIVVCKKHGEVIDTAKGVVLANTRTMYLRAHPEHAGPAAKPAGQQAKGHKAMTTSAAAGTPLPNAKLVDLLSATLDAAKQLAADLEPYAAARWDDCDGCRLEAAAMVAALAPLLVGTATLTTALAAETLSAGSASGAAIPVACGGLIGAAIGAGGVMVAHKLYSSCLESRLRKAPAGSDARARILAAKQQLADMKQRIEQDQAKLAAAWEALKAGAEV